MTCTNERIESILSDPNSSGCLKTGLLSALDREPIVEWSSNRSNERE
jgi:hypothetical protein